MEIMWSDKGGIVLLYVCSSLDLISPHFSKALDLVLLCTPIKALWTPTR